MTAPAGGDDVKPPRRLARPATRAGFSMPARRRLGSDGGGEHWAVIASLIETCKLCNVEPQTYLTDVITRIVTGHPNSQIDDLLPWAYPTASPLRDVA